MSANHGWWCNSVTWPTKCPRCKDSVFFFQCGCGSKVFFDELGPPWPIHDCDTSWTRNLPRTRDNSGAVTVEISPGVTIRRAPDNFSIDSGIISRVQRRKKQQDPIVAINPDQDSGQVTVVGVLREKRIEVDIATLLDLPQNSSMVWGFLGPLARGRWGKVTIHKQSSNEDVLHSYTALVSSKMLEDVKNSTGVTVIAELAAFSVPQIGTFWVCNAYEVLEQVHTLR